MYEDRFSKWVCWADRNLTEGVKYPGIYIIAIADENLSGQNFLWTTDIVYVGMTNSLNGLKGRLRQFDNTIIGKKGHGGADRVRYKHQSYERLVKNLYVAVASFECDVKSNNPEDLRVMGEVAKFEYDCFAYFAELFGQLPEFNDQKRSPKYSLTLGRKS
ncbi:MULTISPECIES: hypothetical protein [unclassified Pseudoalteromonas]|uniref:hypothetical protein n=1 Tax=unclassified Pseudoalteromonas TaxID=194690 RepID=UPI000C08519C|nr:MULTISPECIES: hypothetical protein [unclassified Pseudoalteromonas]MDP2633374.1 hypothetical protein [Pseudoalteromonas sp. 1_MG-2023]PHN91660.1 hypothetical protein CSC79_01065 [Pseudoalteromonas sp. 3D05]